MIDLGTVRPGSTIRIPFSSFDKDDGSAITMTNYAAADILVYKDGSTTERASTSGYTATTDFDSKTGKHLAVIDLADNTTAGFWNAGSEYLVAIDQVTVDAVTTGGWIARFRIGYTSAMLDTTIASLTNQTSFTLTVGPAEDDALNGMWAVIHDIASAVQCAKVLILDYTGSTKTVTLAAGATFTAAAGDNISVMDMAPLQPATTGRTLVVDSAGLADANTVKVGPTGSGTAQTAGDIIGDTNDIQSRLPAALVSGRIDASVGAMAANVMTAAAAAADLTTELQSGLATAASISSLDSKIDTIDNFLDTEVAAILADTNELQTDWADGGRLDLILDARASQTSVNTIDDFLDTEVAAIKAKTDSLTFTVAGSVDANIQHVNDTAVTGDGQPGTEWGPS